MKKFLFFLICIAITVNAKPHTTAEKIAVYTAEIVKATVNGNVEIEDLKDYGMQYNLTLAEMSCSLMVATKDMIENPKKWDKKYPEVSFPSMIFLQILAKSKTPGIYSFLKGTLNNAPNKYKYIFIEFMLMASKKEWYSLCSRTIIDTAFFVSLDRYQIYTSIIPKLIKDTSFSNTHKDSILQLYCKALLYEPRSGFYSDIDNALVTYGKDDYTYSVERRNAILRLETPAMLLDRKSHFGDAPQRITAFVEKVKSLPPEKLHSSPYFKKLFENAEKEIQKAKSKSIKKTTSSSKN